MTSPRFRARPILKRDSCPAPLVDVDELPFTTCDYILSPHVHFPPTPHMTSLRFTHSPNTYDRAPILVSPNGCLLPKRGERTFYSPPADFDSERRGRSRSRSSSRTRDDDSPGDVMGSYFHPRAFEACSPEPLEVPTTTSDNASLPILVPDLSPSDESDDLVETPPDPSAMAAASIAIHAKPAFSAPPLAGKCDVPTNAGHRPPPRSLRRRKEKPDGVRPHLKRNVTFAPDLDEGCLGGF
ncbi:uncharacterized protein B0H18DRAFT_1117324 [Fomitopsis serialis]|uniref:uncharacterized protein n=1 Tax=Fomitopsis serialis TaxID=139415 RepID=UPI002007DA7A|nr:uncharacterized protein B0H18DRAFT_1117324 [Neoantrodia serialis]KAH9929783.1 hypothetical protein B0H18DRAFT_1117324 [Neoantrodia serialis]